MDKLRPEIEEAISQATFHLIPAKPLPIQAYCLPNTLVLNTELTITYYIM